MKSSLFLTLLLAEFPLLLLATVDLNYELRLIALCGAGSIPGAYLAIYFWPPDAAQTWDVRRLLAKYGASFFLGTIAGPPILIRSGLEQGPINAILCGAATAMLGVAVVGIALPLIKLAAEAWLRDRLRVKAPPEG